MMETTFYIALRMRTVNGFETFSKFFVGDDSTFASNVFGKLKGDKNTNEESILQMELTETKNELPLNIKIISCTLEELAENCKVIVKELFKYHNLGWSMRTFPEQKIRLRVQY